MYNVHVYETRHVVMLVYQFPTLVNHTHVSKIHYSGVLKLCIQIRSTCKYYLYTCRSVCMVSIPHCNGSLTHVYDSLEWETGAEDVSEDSGAH